MLRRALIALIACTAPALAVPTLRPHTTLESGQVRVGDLWDGTGARAGDLVGPAPAPGAQIVVGAEQLAHIARLHGIDWHPASGSERTVIDRPGRPLTRDEVIDALRPALTRANDDPADTDIELSAFVLPTVPAGVLPTLSLEQISQDPISGRFGAVLNVMAEGMQPQRLPLSGRVIATQEVPVATRRLPLGTTIAPSDIRMARLPVARLPADVVIEPPVGLTTRRTISPGQPFTTASAARPATIEKGTPVTVTIQNGGLILQLRGRALTSASLGETVQIENPNSHETIEAEVLGPGRARMNTPYSVQENP